MPDKKKTTPTVVPSKLALIKCYLEDSDDDDDSGDEVAQPRTVKVKKSATRTCKPSAEEKRRAEAPRKTKPGGNNKNKAPLSKVESSLSASPSQESSDTASDEQSVHLSSEDEEEKRQKKSAEVKAQRQRPPPALHTVILKDPPATHRALIGRQFSVDNGTPRAAADSAKRSRQQPPASAGNRDRLANAPVSRYASASSTKSMHDARSPSTHSVAGTRRSRTQTNSAVASATPEKRAESSQGEKPPHRVCSTERTVCQREWREVVDVQIAQDGVKANQVTTEEDRNSATKNPRTQKTADTRQDTPKRADHRKSNDDRREGEDVQISQGQTKVNEVTLKEDHSSVTESPTTQKTVDTKRNVQKRVDQQRSNDDRPETEDKKQNPPTGYKGPGRTVAGICEELKAWSSNIVPDFKPSAEATRQILAGKFL